jgi:hypothetical protein
MLLDRMLGGPAAACCRRSLGRVANLAMGRRLFIIRDMTIRGIEEVLEDLCDPHEPHDGIAEAFSHGIDDAEILQGSIGSDVYSRIEHATHVLALMDQPNANVGFEIGYALARGKPVALARVRRDLPEWATINPFPDFHVPRAHDIDQFLALARGDSWILLNRPSAGRETIVLCPDEGSGKSAGRWIQRARARWRRLIPPPLEQLPKALAGVGRAIWVITPSDAERDGPANATNAVVAGVVRGLGLELVVLTHRDQDAAHPIQDVRASQRLWEGREELENALPPVSTEDGLPEPTVGGQLPLRAEPTVPDWPVTTAVESQRLTPAWARPWDSGPPAPIELADWGISTGNRACTEGLLLCVVESRAVQHFWGPAVPTLETVVSWRERTVKQRSSASSLTMHLTAALAQVQAGDSLTFQVWDRGRWLGGAKLLTQAIAAFHGFPFELKNEEISIRCTYVERPDLERALEPILSGCRAMLARLREMSLFEPTPIVNYGQGAREELARAAALVGWADPRVLDLVRDHDQRLGRQRQSLGQQVSQQSAAIADGWSSVGRFEWRAGSLRSGAEPEKGAATSKWDIRVPLRPGPSSTDDWMERGPLGKNLELADSNGMVWTLREADFSMATNAERPIEYEPAEGAAGEPVLPAIIRAILPDGIVLQRIVTAAAS